MFARCRVFVRVHVSGRYVRMVKGSIEGGGKYLLDEVIAIMTDDEIRVYHVIGPWSDIRR